MSITCEKGLWSGKPVWFSYPAPRIPLSALTCDIKADVVVVGAGVTGACVAQELAAQGMRVIILDSQKPTLGSTSATTALLQYDVDMPLTKLSKKIGQDDAIRAWRRSRLGLENIAARTRALGVKCDMGRRDVLYLDGNELDAQGLRKEGEARNAAGLYTEYLDAGALKDGYGIKRKAALRVRDALTINPQRYVSGYLKDALANKAQIFSPVQVTGIQTHRHKVVLQTDQDYEVTARHVVFCTGYELFKGLGFKKKKITSSWAFATKPQPGKLWPTQAHVWEAAKPYLYLRTTVDGRVICGGEDEDFSDEAARDALIPAKTKALQKKLKKLFPRLDTEAEFSWAGSFGETDNSLPMIGAVPRLENVYAVLAWGGNGITFSRIGAEVISSLLQDREDPEADLFRIIS